MDVRGALGLSDDVRNGFERIRVQFQVEGDAPEEKLQELVAARAAALGRLRHGHERRSGVGGGRGGLTRPAPGQPSRRPPRRRRSR